MTGDDDYSKSRKSSKVGRQSSVGDGSVKSTTPVNNKSSLSGAHKKGSFRTGIPQKTRRQDAVPSPHALDKEIIAGVGLDVYDKEPLPQDHKLRFLPNAFLLPHLGYVTAENYSLFYTQMIENMESCLKGKPLRVIS